MKVERSIQHIHLDQEQLLDIVRKAFPHCRKLDGWKVLSGGALNTSYQFQIGVDFFVLRLYARDRSYCNIEKAVHQLIGAQVPTPKLLFADETHEPYAFSIFEFVPGVHLSQVSNEHKIPLSQKLGSILASIHAFKFPAAGLFGGGMKIVHPFELGSNPYFEKTFSVLSNNLEVRSRLGEKLADLTLAFIQKNKEFFPTVEKESICLTHSDFKPVNLLYHPCGKVFVLDWEFVHAGMGILDFAILLRHRIQFPLDLTAISRSYTQHGGSLPVEWLRSSLITDFVNVATLLESPAVRPQLFSLLREIVQNTINQWESRDLDI